MSQVSEVVESNRIMRHSKPNLVLYHANCNDGFCAAWLFWRHMDKKAEFIPVQYGEPFPEVEVEGRSVYIFDFSYPRQVLFDLKARKPASLLVLDHHKTAEEELKGLDFCTFDQERSGASLVCRHFAWNMTWLVQYVEDRDLWKFQMTYTRAVHAGLQLHPYDFETWEFLYGRGSDKLIYEGEIVLKYNTRLVTQAVAQACEIEISGYKVLAVNSTNKAITSDIGHELAKDRPFSIVWFATRDQLTVSLRSSKDGIDVAEFAQQCGGGGHKHAAGFTIPNPLYQGANIFHRTLIQAQLLETPK